MCLPGSSVSEVVMPNIEKSHTQILNSGNMCYIPFERAKRALSNAIYSFLWELIFVFKKATKRKGCPFSSMHFSQHLHKKNLGF